MCVRTEQRYQRDTVTVKITDDIRATEGQFKVKSIMRKEERSQEKIQKKKHIEKL